MRKGDKVDELLAKMLDADPVLYEKILETPGFSGPFNQLCLMAKREAAFALKQKPEKPEQVHEFLRRVKAQTCPTCKAGPQEPCTTPGGADRGPHDRRVTLADKERS